MENAEGDSHITILRPREVLKDESFIDLLNKIKLFFEGELWIFKDYHGFYNGIRDRDKWENRKEFLLQTLAFCLSLPNLWRFPKKALTEGQGAFVWLYILFMGTVGTALLFFEVGLGQYSSKGFHKVFAMCPLFEGISYAMAFYCAIVSTYYNMLNAYSFIYLFASFNSTLEYTLCNDAPPDICQEGTTNHTMSPEYVYFAHRIVHYTSFNATDNDISLYAPNWRNVGVLFFLWVMICIVILRGIRTAKWPAKVYCPIPYLVLIITLSVSLTMKGARTGLKTMFSMKLNDLMDLNIWRSAFEQSVVSLGIGMGPLITLGSYSKFQSPADKDSFVLCACTLIGSLLTGSVLFCGAGVMAFERNQTMTTVFKTDGEYSSDLSVHIIFSQLIGRMPSGVSHGVSFLFFFTFLLAGWYSLITYTETFIVSCYTFFPTSYKHRVYTNLGLCMACYILGATLASRAGYEIIVGLDRLLVAAGLLIIVLCELSAVIYIYGLHDFCDDIDFMLGFYPNLYYQAMWVFTPIGLLIVFFQFLYAYSLEPLTEFEKYTIIITGIAILLPIIIIGLYNMYRCYKTGNIKYVLSPREVILLEDEDFMMHSYLERSWHKHSDTKTIDSAGPSIKRQ